MMKAVLLVDDQELNLRLMSALLAQKGYAVYTATSADEARQVFAAEHIDCVVTDYHMPGEDGYSLVRTLRALSCGAAVRMALVSGDGLADEQIRGVDAFLNKPVTCDELVAFLEG